MKIVVLDGYTLNPGDLSWGGLQALGKCEIYERSAPAEVVPRSREAEVLITNKVVLSREQIFALPELRYIGVTATGYNIVDVAAARERNVSVCNVPAYGTKSVAQMTMALLLELTQHVGHHAQTVRDGRWSQCPDFCYWDYPLIELNGLAMGIVGYGRIGAAVGELARAFGMRVLATKRSSTESKRRPLTPALSPGGGEGDIPQPEFVDLETLFRTSDVVSLHCPLTPETKHLVNAERLALMKPTAFLLNTSRGPLVDEPALAAALNSGRIAGAGLDVLSVEPPVSDHSLFATKNCYITPHIAWATRAARGRLLQTSITNVEEFLRGKPVNVVN